MVALMEAFNADRNRELDFLIEALHDVPFLLHNITIDVHTWVLLRYVDSQKPLPYGLGLTPRVLFGQIGRSFCQIAREATEASDQKNTKELISEYIPHWTVSCYARGIALYFAAYHNYMPMIELAIEGGVDEQALRLAAAIALEKGYRETSALLTNARIAPHARDE